MSLHVKQPFLVRSRALLIAICAWFLLVCSNTSRRGFEGIKVEFLCHVAQPTEPRLNLGDVLWDLSTGGHNHWQETSFRVILEIEFCISQLKNKRKTEDAIQ